MRLQQIKTDIVGTHPSYSFRIRSVGCAPKMKVNCKFQRGDTNESQWTALIDALQLFRSDVEIKIRFHAEDGSDQIGTNWIALDRSEQPSFSELVLSDLAAFCGSGKFIGDIVHWANLHISTDIATRWGYIKEAVNRGLIEEYSLGDDQCYRQVTKGGEQP